MRHVTAKVITDAVNVEISSLNGENEVTAQSREALEAFLEALGMASKARLGAIKVDGHAWLKLDQADTLAVFMNLGKLLRDPT